MNDINEYLAHYAGITKPPPDSSGSHSSVNGVGSNANMNFEESPMFVEEIMRIQKTTNQTETGLN